MINGKVSPVRLGLQLVSQRRSWQDGRRAWERLNGCHRSSVSLGPRRGIAGAERAPGDVPLVGRLLDLAEMNAARATRRAAGSWTDVAPMLVVSRQSAWKRPRDVDDAVCLPGGGADA